MGRRNRKLFLYFLAAGIIYLTYIAYFTLMGFLEGGKMTFSSINITKIYLLIHCTIISLFLVVLLILQITLISTGITTVEFFKTYIPTRKRPFNEGCLNNWISFWKMKREYKDLSFDKLKKLQKTKHSVRSCETDLEIPLAINEVY